MSTAREELSTNPGAVAPGSSELFVHPTQASRVRLRVFREPAGYLVIEERLGTVSVRHTLGLFDTQDAAAERLRSREKDLLAQRYRRVDA